LPGSEDPFCSLTTESYCLHMKIYIEAYRYISRLLQFCKE